MENTASNDLPAIVPERDSTPRPDRLFLVESAHPNAGRQFSRFVLAWKHDTELHWLQAGRGGGTIGPISSAMTQMRETGDAKPPTAETIVRDLRPTNFAGIDKVLRAWDVSVQVGRHHPRIRRAEIIDGGIEEQLTLTPSACGLDPALTSSTVAAKLLLDELEDVCGVVEPDGPDQLAVFGHRLRHLLISACTEVESAWRSVLEANDPSPPALPNTGIYVRLADPMRLREWRVRFTRSAAPLVLVPFGGWIQADPTKSLPWYSAYQLTKHAREGRLGEAKLGHVIDALAALYALLIAQFGTDAVNERLRSQLFEVEQAPVWEPHELYVASPFDIEHFRAEPLFAQARTTKAQTTQRRRGPGSTTSPRPPQPRPPRARRPARRV